MDKLWEKPSTLSDSAVALSAVGWLDEGQFEALSLMRGPLEKSPSSSSSALYARFKGFEIELKPFMITKTVFFFAGQWNKFDGVWW